MRIWPIVHSMFYSYGAALIDDTPNEIVISTFHMAKAGMDFQK